MSTYNKENYQKNKKKIQEQQKKYYIENREQILERTYKRRRENPEQYKERMKIWRDTKADKEKYRKQKREWYEKNRERLGHRRLELRYKVFEQSNFSCSCCGRKPPEIVLEIDHINPKSKGGENSIENYRAICRECNLGKKDFILNEFKK